MLSSLQALNAAGVAPASRSAAFQPKCKPRPRRGSSQTEENNVTAAPSTQESVVVPSTQESAAVIDERPAVPPPVVLHETAEAPAAPEPPILQPQKDNPSRSGHSAADVSDNAGAGSSRGKQPVSTVPTPSVSAAANTPSSSNHSPETGESSKGKRKRVSSSSAPRKRRVEILDEDFDPSKMTMKDIIRHAEAKERKKQKEEEAAKKMEQQSSSSAEERTDQQQEREQGIPLAPQVQIVDGKIVINQQSMAVDARTLNTNDLGSYRRIEESSSKLNYHSYMKKVSRERWKTEETETFYRAVQQFGTDFALIERLLPGKSRSQIKAKFKKEERFNSRRLSDSILQPRTDVTHYEDLVNQLMASAAAERAGADDFAFTWDVNAERTTTEDGTAAEEEMATGDDYNHENSVADPEEIDDDPGFTSNALQSSPKKEEFPGPNDLSSEKLGEEPSTTKSELSSPLFAYEMEAF